MSRRTERKKRQRKTRKAKEAIRWFISRNLVDVRERFARELKARLEADPAVPLPCETCALRASTDGFSGFEATILGFVNSLASEGATPFACHEPEPHPWLGYRPRRDEAGNLVLCAGYMILEPLDIRQIIAPALVDKMVEMHKALHPVCVMPDWV